MAPARRLTVPEAARLFALLGEPGRLRVLVAVRDRGEASVSDVVAAVGRPQPSVSNQLALLRAGGVVAARRAGHQVFYRITSPLVLDLLRAVGEE